MSVLFPCSDHDEVDDRQKLHDIDDVPEHVVGYRYLGEELNRVEGYRRQYRQKNRQDGSENDVLGEFRTTDSLLEQTGAYQQIRSEQCSEMVDQR